MVIIRGSSIIPLDPRLSIIIFRVLSAGCIYHSKRIMASAVCLDHGIPVALSLIEYTAGFLAPYFLIGPFHKRGRESQNTTAVLLRGPGVG